MDCNEPQTQILERFNTPARSRYVQYLGRDQLDHAKDSAAIVC